MDWAWAEWDRTSCEGDHRSIGPNSLAKDAREADVVGGWKATRVQV